MTDALLSASHVSVERGGRTIVHDVSLTLRTNELVALVGPNGAGKTTLIKALAGLLPARGTIAIDGRALSTMPAHERARNLAYLPQGHDFSWPLPAAQIVALGRYPHADPFSRVSQRDRDAVTHALEITGTTALADRIVTTLSGGERARVALARVLATQAPILLADEPTMSLDPLHQFLVMALLRKAAQADGAALVVVHDLALAARYADRVVVLDHGCVVADDTPDIALSRERIAQVFGVEADIVANDGLSLPLVRGPL